HADDRVLADEREQPEPLLLAREWLRPSWSRHATLRVIARTSRRRHAAAGARGRRPSPRCWLRAPAFCGARWARARWAQALVKGRPPVCARPSCPRIALRRITAVP